jgi:hypothetical protein
MSFKFELVEAGHHIEAIVHIQGKDHMEGVELITAYQRVRHDHPHSRLLKVTQIA